ncbi:LysR family transcriptional regulator [Luteibacter sp.]|jgi:DNA-binding transcriptional LysR family regulator|uniref:LysR family transcriptional regulator n=1 Tax=Luteibacter sp. TaxID=1886636 RepID=UPI002F3F6195
MQPSERLNGIGVFVAVADAGSFTAAAERLHLTASAVGKAIGRLEARLGKRLFARSTRRVTLTDEGEAYLRVCRSVLGELEEAEQVLLYGSDAPVGKLRIDLPVTFGRLKVMPVLLPFLVRHADLRPVISFTDRFVDIVDEGIDVGIRVGHQEVWPEAIGRAYLGKERKVFCASPDYLAAHGEPTDAMALRTHSAVLYGKSDATPAPWLIGYGTAPVEQFLPEARLILGNAEAQVDAAMAGAGVAQLPTWLIDEHLQRGELRHVLPGFDIEGLPVHVTWPRSRRLLAKVDATVTHLVNTVPGLLSRQLTQPTAGG